MGGAASSQFRTATLISQLVPRVQYTDENLRNLSPKNRKNSEDSSFYRHVEIVYSSDAATFQTLSTSRIEDFIVTCEMIDQDFDLRDVFDKFNVWMKFDFHVTRLHLDLVSRNWRCVLTGTDSFIFQQKYTSPSAFFSGELYSNVFEKLPEAVCLFRQNNPDTIGGALVRMISASIRMLSQPQSLLKTLYLLGDRHISYGIENASSLGVFCECLVFVIRSCSGSSWGEQLEDAWNQIISMFVLAMGSRILRKKAAPANC